MSETDCGEIGLAEKSKPAAGEKIENDKLEGVKVQEAIIKLKLLGQMPDAVKDDPTVETINMYDELLSNVKTPLTREEVGVLIDIFPEVGMYGDERRINAPPLTVPPVFANGQSRRESPKTASRPFQNLEKFGYGGSCNV